MAKKKTKTSEPDKVPPVPYNQFTFAVSSEEISSLLQILSFSRGVFEQMAVNSIKDGDPKAGAVYSARSQLSDILYHKFKDLAGIGEPDSRDLH